MSPKLNKVNESNLHIKTTQIYFNTRLMNELEEHYMWRLASQISCQPCIFTHYIQEIMKYSCPSLCWSFLILTQQCWCCFIFSIIWWKNKFCTTKAEVCIFAYFHFFSQGQRTKSTLLCTSHKQVCTLPPLLENQSHLRSQKINVFFFFFSLIKSHF